LAPAAASAGSGLLIGLAVAVLVAYCNATSSARLAALYPVSGGTYVYGRHRLGEFWGYLAGWGFVVGKAASCMAMALTVGMYAWPAHAHAVAVIAVVALTTVNYFGVQKSGWATRLIVLLVLAVLVVVVVALCSSAAAELSNLASPAKASPTGVLQAAGLLFFAFAGYARIATLGTRSGAHDTASYLDGACDHLDGLCGRGRRGAGGSRACSARHGDGAGDRSGRGRRFHLVDSRGVGRGGSCRAGFVAGVDPWGIPHDAGDGP
jgi:Amino acid permease